VVHKKPFTRTFIEAGLPAWGMLVILMFLGRGNLNGNAGLLVLLAFICPGAWGAIRLERPSGNGLKRLGVYLFFCAAQGAAIAFILLASLLILRLLGAYRLTTAMTWQARSPGI
jgi:hypothetical protein